nr:SUMF1/EgtB/PvdO family nonheme iron enzyme [Salinicola tamaricis]
MKPWSILAAIISLSLTACGQSNADPENQQAVDALIKKTKDELVRVEGGTFQMGDFGPIDPNLKGSDKGLPYSADQDNKPLHEVTLDTFYMSPTKVTYADYDVYTQATGKDKINSTNQFEMQFRQDNVPAGVDWYQAKNYCDWLAKETSLPFSCRQRRSGSTRRVRVASLYLMVLVLGLWKKVRAYPRKPTSISQRALVIIASMPLIQLGCIRRTVWGYIKWVVMVTHGLLIGISLTTINILPERIRKVQAREMRKL